MNIIVTGVSRGVGLAITEVLLREGEHVFGISRVRTAELEKLSETYPATFSWLGYDLASAENVHDDIFKKWIGTNTEVHGYVNNAAIAYDDLVTNLNLDSLEKMFRVNVLTPMNMTKYVIRQTLLHQNKCSIIHLSSISVHTGYKGLAMYASTKGALEAFSKNTAREWGERGVRSNCVVAGFMETDMSASLTTEQKDRIYRRTSLKTPVSKESVAETVSFLLSDKSSSITGQNIFVDSGTI